MNKVKNMPRQQQKAVFAHIKDPDAGYLNRLEGAEKYQRRREFLMKKRGLEEDYEDKVFNAWNDKNLTYEQRKRKVAKLQEEARKKLAKAKGEESSPTITGQIKKERLRKYKIQAAGNPPKSNKAERAEWNAFNFAVSKTRQYKKYKARGYSNTVARDLAMKDLDITPETRKGAKWYSIENLPTKQLRKIAQRYKSKIDGKKSVKYMKVTHRNKTPMIYSTK